MRSGSRKRRWEVAVGSGSRKRQCKRQQEAAVEPRLLQTARPARRRGAATTPPSQWPSIETRVWKVQQFSLSAVARGEEKIFSLWIKLSKTEPSLRSVYQPKPKHQKLTAFIRRQPIECQSTCEVVPLTLRCC